MYLNQEFHLDAVEIGEDTLVVHVKKIVTEGTQVEVPTGDFHSDVTLEALLEVALETIPKVAPSRKSKKEAHLPLITYLAKFIARNGIALFQLIPLAYKLLAGWYIFYKINKFKAPTLEEILYFYGVKPQSMRKNCKKLGSYKLEKYLDAHCPTKPIPRSVETEELSNKVAQYKAFIEAQLKVEGLVTTPLLREHGLIVNFHSIDIVSNWGQSQAPKEAKEEISCDLAKILAEATKED
uniref:Uncharacterized protein n=1 Tax=Cannabis sativa TaxID=3483 RepID=A0A803PY46_CANSA